MAWHDRYLSADIAGRQYWSIFINQLCVMGLQQQSNDHWSAGQFLKWMAEVLLACKFSISATNIIVSNVFRVGEFSGDKVEVIGQRWCVLNLIWQTKEQSHYEYSVKATLSAASVTSADTSFDCHADQYQRFSTNNFVTMQEISHYIMPKLNSALFFFQ